MGYITVLLIALSLAVDAFAVSVTNGIVVSDFRRRHAVKIGLYFGVFQFLMPLIGYALGSSFEKLIEAYDHWIAFSLLAIIGGSMIAESFKDEETECIGNSAKQFLSPMRLVTQAIATSIDALAVGISFAVTKTQNIFANALIIGVVAFVCSFFGGIFGKKIGGIFRCYASRIGGIVLIGIGIKILIEHLLV